MGCHWDLRRSRPQVGADQRVSARRRGGYENLRVQQLLQAGESRAVEFKASRRALNRDLYETICAFLNGEGGDILPASRMTRRSWCRPGVRGADAAGFRQCHQQSAKINPPCYLGIEEVEYDGATLCSIFWRRQVLRSTVAGAGSTCATRTAISIQPTIRTRIATLPE